MCIRDRYNIETVVDMDAEGKPVQIYIDGVCKYEGTAPAGLADLGRPITSECITGAVYYMDNLFVKKDVSQKPQRTIYYLSLIHI